MPPLALFARGGNIFAKKLFLIEFYLYETTIEGIKKR